MQNKIAKVAKSAALLAGAKILKLAQSPISYTMKNKRDILAAADVASEKIILGKIQKNFPGHSILSEEAGVVGQKSDYIWIVDPLDGTINFSRGIDEWCISIAVEHKGILIYGLVYQPTRKLLFEAVRGQGARLNGKRIHVSAEAKPIQMLAAIDNSAVPAARKKNFKLLSDVCSEFRHMRIFGSAALHLARLASGQIDCYFKSYCNYWDNAAGIILVEEAGGIVTDFEGRPASEQSKTFVATNNKAHKEIIGMLKKA